MKAKNKTYANKPGEWNTPVGSDEHRTVDICDLLASSDTLQALSFN